MMVVNTNILASCSVKDEGRPLDIALQERVSNYFRMLQSKAVALSVEEKDVQKRSSDNHGVERKQTAEDAS